jgi:hypothetical protein
MSRIFEDGWYWLSKNNGNWTVVHVKRGIVYFNNALATRKADDRELNNMTRIKINPPNLDYNVTAKWS